MSPIACKPEAYSLFARQLPNLDSTAGLWKAVAAISTHILDDVDFEKIDARFDALAASVRAGIKSDSHDALLAHLHSVLFEQEQFSGALENYYSTANSYLSNVLETRRGLPIVLALIYKVVAERVGLHVEGINSPGHFMAGIQSGGKWLIVDPFYHGQMLTPEEALDRLTDLTGETLVGKLEVLAPATHHQWVARVLQNLQIIFAAEGRQGDLAAMNELQELLANSV